MTMLITSATITWPFPRNSPKHGTRSSMTRGTTSGIPKNKVQQTRLLHLAKGRKVSRKVICDAASPERELRQDDDDDHDGAHAGCARARFSPARYGAQRAQVSVTEVQPQPGVKSVKIAR